MPYARRRTNRRPRNRRRRRPRRYRRKVNLKANSGFPAQIYTKVVYAETFSLASTSGAIANQSFSGNSPYDPDSTGVGHQPYFYDQLTTIYNSYMCYGSKIEIIAGTNSSTDARMVLRPSIPATAIGDIDLECERPHAKCWYIKPEGESRPRMKYASTRRIFGTQNKTLDENFQAASSANPNNRWYWLIGMKPTDDSSTITCQMTVKITYYCRFFDRATVSSS